jgi:hypothetical protein
MELDRVAAALRPRRPWEGLDLGFALGRAWFRTLWPLWWIGVLPIGLLGLGLTRGRADLCMILLWWLKPLYEAPLVYWTSRALFGETPSLRELRAILCASWTRRLLPFLLWRRLSPSRSFAMPIALLEGLRGSAARQRRRILSDGTGTAGWLTLVCYHFEAILWGGLLLTLYFLVPEEMPRIDLGSALTDSGSWPYWVSGLLYLLAFSIVAPFYVCAGFALYLTRRTELEAWDLELAFRQVRSTDRDQGQGLPGRPRTLGPRARTPGAILASALALAVLASAPGATSHAADPPDPAEARALIAEVLADEAFGRTRKIETWVPIAQPGEEVDPPAWLGRLGDAAAAIGLVLKWLLLAIAVAAVVLLARRVIRDWRPAPRRRRATRTPGPSSRPMLQDPGPDPGQLAALVHALLATGDTRGALALLYRGTLAHLARRGAQVPQGATEGEALGLAARHLSTPELEPFRQIARDWQGLAYAHRVPEPQAIAQRLARWLAGIASIPDTGVGPSAEADHAP